MNNAAANLDLNDNSNTAQSAILALANPNIEASRLEHEQEIAEALTRRGPPRCTEKDFQELLHLLGCAGYGWLRREGVRSRLKQIVRQGKERPE